LTQPTLSVELGRLEGWVLGESLLGTDTTLAEYVYEDITSRVIDLNIRRGRQHELDRIEAGTLSGTLMNQDGAFNPLNTLSQYYPDIRPMVPLRIRATWPVLPVTAGLAAWYDFSDASTLFEDTARTDPVDIDTDMIKGVTDLSDNGNHLSEATNGPTYKVNIQNGLSVARFDGTNDTLVTAAFTAPTTGWTLFFVGAATTLDTSLRVLISLGIEGTVLIHTDTDTHATAFNYYSNGAGGITANVLPSAASMNVRAVRANSTASADFYNGGGTPANLDPLNTILTTATTICLGANTASASFAIGDIGEVVFYDSALTAAQMNSLGSYFATKWGLTWTPI
jgi:hypothetical protein